MIKVYFEMSEAKVYVLVAIFDSEDVYDACRKSLEEKCIRDGYDFMTHSVKEDSSFEDIDAYYPWLQTYTN